MALENKIFTNIIRKLEKAKESLIYLKTEHREIITVRVNLLNQKLAEHGISSEDLSKIQEYSDVELGKRKLKQNISRKEKEVEQVRKEIILSKKGLTSKDAQRQKKIQLDRVDRLKKENENQF